MKSSFLSTLVLLTVATGFTGMTFDDIDTWVGSGSNQAALVIDWNDGQSELVKVWGFRWDGDAYGTDMIQAACQADSELYAMGSVSSYGLTIGGLGYDKDGDGVFDITKTDETSNFDAGGYMTVANNAFDGWSAIDTGDNWVGGWMSDGFWGYYITEGGVWQSPAFGASGRLLQNGSWDGWSWGSSSSGWNGGVPSVAVAVPEPISLILFGAGLVLARKRK